MPLFAHVEDGVVLNAVLADNKQIADEVTGASCFPCPDNVGVGWIYNDKTKQFSYPVIEEIV